MFDTYVTKTIQSDHIGDRTTSVKSCHHVYSQVTKKKNLREKKKFNLFTLYTHTPQISQTIDMES